MVPKLHAKGKSFAGAAQYLLHDKGRASTAERVEWVETRNLATGNPEAAWRVMAATAMDQARLKTEAGIKNTGRKSKDHVLHLTLSWHPDESAEVTPEEMRRAAQGALRALGADDRQALIVCHNDEPQAHVHLLINRVSSLDGRMLSSSKEKLKLSAWAEAYEKERGQVYCDERVINNAARKRGEYTRGRKDQSRNVYEMEGGNDNRPDAKAIRDEQRRKATALAKRARALQKRHRRQAAKVEADHKKRVAHIVVKTKKDIELRQEAVRKGYRPTWGELHHEHQAQKRLFEKRETQLIGRMQNRLNAIDFRSLVGRKVDGEPVSGIRGAFDAIGSAGARLEALKRQQERDCKALEKEQKDKERQAAAVVRAQARQRLEENRRRFVAERMQFVLSRDMDRAALRASWRKTNDERREAWKPQPILVVLRDSRESASSTVTRAQQIDGQKTRSARRAERKRNRRDRDRGDDERGR